MQTLFRKTFKWLVVPVACAAFGYFVIGKHLGQDAIKKVPGMSSIAPELAPSSSADDKAAAPDSEAPEVDISVRPSR